MAAELPAIPTYPSRDRPQPDDPLVGVVHVGVVHREIVAHSLTTADVLTTRDVESSVASFRDHVPYSLGEL